MHFTGCKSNDTQAHIMTYFKNEAHILTEWILVHRQEQFKCIWLLDNGSTDNPYVQIKNFDNVVYHNLGSKYGQQYTAYTKYFPEVVNYTEILCKLFFTCISNYGALGKSEFHA